MKEVTVKNYQELAMRTALCPKLGQEVKGVN